MTDKLTRFVWLDLETTGLSPQEHLVRPRREGYSIDQHRQMCKLVSQWRTWSAEKVSS